MLLYYHFLGACTTVLKGVSFFFCACLWGIMLSLSAHESPVADEQTIINADCVEILAQGAVHTFYFKGRVVVQSPQLNVQCDELQVFIDAETPDQTPIEVKEASSVNRSSAMPLTLTPNGGIGSASKIIASGNVKILQNDRLAEAGRAEIFPKDNRIILAENPVVTDPQGVIRGFRIVLYRDAEGVQRVSVEGDPELPAQRPCIVLPMHKDLL